MNQVVFKNFANAPLNWINFPHNFPRFRMYHATLILFIVNFILIVFVANYDFFSIFWERLFNPAYDHVVNWTYSYPVNAWIPIKQLLISSPKIILLSLMFFLYCPWLSIMQILSLYLYRWATVTLVPRAILTSFWPSSYSGKMRWRRGWS